jgi:hypothetical protein
MQYKTIVLELLKQRPQLYDQLRKEDKLMERMEFLAAELKMRHDFWKEQLSRTRPKADPGQIASEAMELALKGLEDYLPPESPED